MKHRLKSVLATSLFIVLFAVGASSVDAASLDFKPDSTQAAVDETFSVDVDLDAGTDQVAGTDIYILYDEDLISLQSVTGGDYFPLVNNIPSEGRLYISGVVANQGEYKTGQGTVATLVFKAVEAGETDLSFECDLTKSDTSKIVQNDINASNIIDCSALEEHIVTIVGGDTATSAGDTPDTLPESGVYDSVVQYASWGVLFLFAGVALRLLMYAL